MYQIKWLVSVYESNTKDSKSNINLLIIQMILLSKQSKALRSVNNMSNYMLAKHTDNKSISFINYI